MDSTKIITDRLSQKMYYSINWQLVTPTELSLFIRNWLFENNLSIVKNPSPYSIKNPHEDFSELSV